MDSKSVVRDRDIVWHRFVVFHSLRPRIICAFSRCIFLPYHISCHIIYRWREIGGITTIDSYYGYGGSAPPPTTGSLLTNRITSSVDSYSSLGSPSLRSLTHSLRSFIDSLPQLQPSLLRRSSLTAGMVGSCFVGVEHPYWSIERSYRRWGAVPPFIERSYRRRGAEPL